MNTQNDPSGGPASAKCPFHGMLGRLGLGGAKPAAGPTLAERLKTETWPMHQRAEHHPFQAGIMKGRVPRAGYVAQLEQALLVHEALESALIATRDSAPAVRALWRDHYARVPHARADLGFLGGSLTPTALAPTAALLSEITDAARHHPHVLIGYLYVLEGSTNGAKFIGKALAKAYGLSDGRGLSYQDPHGDQQAARWAEFKTALTNLPLSPAQQSEVVDAARGLFSWTVQLFDVLAERFPVAADSVAADSVPAVVTTAAAMPAATA